MRRKLAILLLSAAAFGPPFSFAQETPAAGVDADALARQLSNSCGSS